MQPIIEVSSLSKKYQIGVSQPYLTLRDTLMEAPRALLGNWLGTKAALQKGEFWALKDVSFTVRPGEVLGVIGRNGAGKSTLLKVLSRITYPTSGEVKLRGNVASLLEVGTGFSPELTGRENIFLNGTILGMTRKEISRKFDEIVSFADIERFLDTPVKRYSSGMYMRLAFAVAAHLEPDILLVDEVLAVGDAEFQKKCLRKMSDVTSKDGRTIVFISHNMSAIQQLCQQVILLKKGRIEKAGNTAETVSYYLYKQEKNLVQTFPAIKYKDAQITSIALVDTAGKPSVTFPFDNNFIVKVGYRIRKQVNKVTIGLDFFTNGEIIFQSCESDSSGQIKTISPGEYSCTVKIPANTFNTNNYYLDVSIQRPGIEYLDRVRNIPFEIVGGRKLGHLAAILEYSTVKNNEI